MAFKVKPRSFHGNGFFSILSTARGHAWPLRAVGTAVVRRWPRARWRDQTAFRDLREGRTEEEWSLERSAAVMSTAEAVTVAAAITRQGAFFPAQKDPLSLLPGYLLGVVLKDNQEDRDRLLAYWDGPVRRRGEGDALWKRMYELRKVLEEMDAT
jgi:hypothetical protein